MAQAQHTPGPFVFTGDAIMAGKQTLARVYHHYTRTIEETDANGELFAASDKLLAACKLARSKLHAASCTCRNCKTIDEAIAQAEGGAQ